MALVGIGVFACLPLGLGYLTYGHDLSIHLSRIEGLKAGLLAGSSPCAWTRPSSTKKAIRSA